MCELAGPVADRIRALNARFDPRMAAELPPHITVGGSSGMGPVPSSTTDKELREKLTDVAQTTKPFAIHFQPPMRFMQSTVVGASHRSKRSDPGAARADQAQRLTLRATTLHLYSALHAQFLS
jgi:hypothetical protein